MDSVDVVMTVDSVEKGETEVEVVVAVVLVADWVISVVEGAVSVVEGALSRQFTPLSQTLSTAGVWLLNPTCQPRFKMFPTERFAL